MKSLSLIARARAGAPSGAGKVDLHARVANRFAWAVVIVLAAVPLYAAVAAQPYLQVLFTRIVILAIAAVSLDLILGVGGLVSFGHAVFFGIGAYATGMLVSHGVLNGWTHLGAVMLACAVVASVSGAIALRTSGVGFIMITLAFAQMFYFLAVSLRDYGGDDGFALDSGSRFGPLSLSNPNTLYTVAAILLVALIAFGRQFLRTPAGMTLGGIRINERRMRALGVPTARCKLAVYVVSAMICGVAGMLFANQTQFVAPSYMAWTMSGDLIVMVVIGGSGTIVGAVIGTLALLLAEEVLKGMTEHWMLILGPLIVMAVLVSQRGIVGIGESCSARSEARRQAHRVNEREQA